jgi:hypothetical protein
MATSTTFQTQIPKDNFDETPIPEKLVLVVYLTLRAVPMAAFLPHESNRPLIQTESLSNMHAMICQLQE